MARHYMQDITPEDGGEKNTADIRMTPERSIRNIEPSEARLRMTRPMPNRAPERPPKRRFGIWIVALVALCVALVAGVLLFFPGTTVTITPRSQTVPFDSVTLFTAYPKETAPPNSIGYTIFSQVFEDSAVVEANGIEKVEEQASGKITIYNEHSASPVRLIKNTRFQSPDGHIFRIPASVDVPGKTGTPGSIEVTVVADAAGEEYNVPPGRFTLPGLRSTPDMYEKVYARSTTAFTGGFIGNRPAVPEATLDAARAEIRNRLTEKVNGLAAATTPGTFTFPTLARMSFETLPPREESGGNVRINEKVTVTMPLFDEGSFANAVGGAVSASAEGHTLTLVRSSDLSASSSLATLVPGESFVFSLSGVGQLIWNVDEEAVKTALLGKEETAFESIIGAFPSVDTARARITPLWAKTFPKDPSRITIEVETPPRPF